MISTVRVHKLFQIIQPFLKDLPREKRMEIFKQIEKTLGYSAEKAARLRKEAKSQDTVIDAIVAMKL